jgi:hypothetical protein
MNLTLAQPVAAIAAAHPHRVSLVILVLALMLAAAISAGSYAISIRLHPWRPCRRCGESGKHRGSIFPRSFRACARCGGTGRELRRFARAP